MKIMLILFYVVIAMVSIVRISLMPIKLSTLCCVAWGLVVAILTYRLSEFSASEVRSLLNIKDIVVLEFIEVAIMMGYLFSSRKRISLLHFYPGLMIFFSLVPISLISLSNFAGVDFTIVALLAGIGVFVLLLGGVLLLRCLKVDKSMLYAMCMSAIIISIIIYGME